ncbi:MAG: asparagine synthase (glutamine-hydrolyzing) [Acidimicrobiales bacterium]
MCGIAGCVLPPGQSPPGERLEAMRAALRHRGPDASGIEVVGNVGLVHTRLSIVDLSERARQPMRHPGGQWWLTYNGEIFNHMAVRAELAGERSASLATFVSTSDTETLLAALARWGPGALPRLNGQFAFAALDLSRRRLVLARDRFGIKPLYLARADGGIWFASEPAALLAAGLKPVPRGFGWPAALSWSSYRRPETLLDQIERLPPGSYLEIALDSLAVSTHRWYSPASHVDPARQEELQAKGRPALVSELAGTLRAAVQDALLGDVPMGALCSGGVDSSLVTALAGEHKRDFVAFGARFRGDTALDEGPAAQRAAEAAGVELDLLEVTKAGWRSGFVEATLHFGAPLATASSVTIAQMAERARRRGIKVLLTGEGADELFAGYSPTHQGLLAGFLTPAQRAGRDLEAALFGHPLWTARSALGWARRLTGATSTAPSPLLARLAGSYRDEVAAAELQAAYAHHTGPRGAFETMLLRQLDFSLCHLLSRMDRNMMQVSVEARVPFLDPRVVGLALTLPLEARVAPWTKGILRDVARQVLPWRSAHRRKIYGMIFDAGAWVEDAADPRFLSDGIFRDLYSVPAKEFGQLLAEARGSLRVRLWSAEVWCRSVFGGDSPATIEKELWPQGP